MRFVCRVLPLHRPQRLVFSRVSSIRTHFIPFCKTVALPCASLFDARPVVLHAFSVAFWTLFYVDRQMYAMRPRGPLLVSINSNPTLTVGSVSTLRVVRMFLFDIKHPYGLSRSGGKRPFLSSHSELSVIRVNPSYQSTIQVGVLITLLLFVILLIIILSWLTIVFFLFAYDKSVAMVYVANYTSI